MADFESRVCGNEERSATVLCESKRVFTTYAIIPISVFDFLAGRLLAKATGCGV
jgi:hypothetical protein